MPKLLAARVALILAAGLNLVPLAYTGLLIASGTSAGGDYDARLRFIAANPVMWSLGWVLWMGGTVGLVLSIWTLNRVMRDRPGSNATLLSLATVFAILGGASDIVGDAIQVTTYPTLAAQYVAGGDPGTQTTRLLFDLVDHLSTALSGGVANTLYFVAGVLVVIALARVSDFPRWITALGGVAWLATLGATPAVFFPSIAPVAVASALFLYSAWLGAIVIWGMGTRSTLASRFTSSAPRV